MAHDIHVAVIGVGNIGKHHARVYSELDGINLVAVADTDVKAGHQVANKFKCRYYPDYARLLKKEKIDAVSIAVPTSLHRKVALACIEQGINVLIEKPIANTIKAATEIIAQGRKKKVRVCIGHVERFNPIVQRLKKLIKHGRFGHVISINSRRVGLFPPQIRDTDVILDLAVHDIDVCNFLLDSSPEEVLAHAGKALNSRRFDYASIFLRYNSTDVVLQVNWITPVKVRELMLTGDKGYAELNYLTQMIRLYKSNYSKEFDTYGDYVIKFGVQSTQELNLQGREPLKSELEGFVSYIRNGYKRNVVTGEEGLANLRIALAAIRSAERNNNGP
jgi:UDP-N-acetylglucosamine 3-dehydrogenase